MFQYLKNSLSEICICTRVGKTYSSNKNNKMIWVLHRDQLLHLSLFNIIIHNLPKALSNNTHVAQYADDITIWVNTTLRKHTNKRVVSYVQKLYQSEMNKLTAYMKENGFKLSQECFLIMEKTRKAYLK